MKHTKDKPELIKVHDHTPTKENAFAVGAKPKVADVPQDKKDSETIPAE